MNLSGMGYRRSIGLSASAYFEFSDDGKVAYSYEAIRTFETISDSPFVRGA